MISYSARFEPNYAVLRELANMQVNMAPAGQVGLQEARIASPDDTGNLDRKMYYDARTGRNVVRLVSPAPYSYYVEYGTDDTDAQPFINDALSGPRVVGDVSREVGNSLERMRYIGSV